MTTITDKLAGILSTIRRDGDFYASGTVEMAIPALDIDGVGRISLPLLPVQAEQLIANASHSPFGRGEQTLIDPEVRKTWQIQAEHVHLAGRRWSAAMDAIVAKAAAGLGVMKPVSAELYKMLIYDTGSFFVEHRDTEKSAGMFATLVLVLPSVCEGGELIVRHRDREVYLNLNTSEPADVSFAAFYADCVHEVKPVKSGYRLSLVYNLVRKGRGATVPAFPDYEKECASITALLQRWVENKNSPDDDAPEKLVYPLEHAYTLAELAFDALKSADRAAASVLVRAAAAADCELHLALMTIEESGTAEYGYARGRRSRRHHDDTGYTDDFEIGEVLDQSLTVSDWRTPDGARPALTTLPFDEDELCPPDVFADVEPDEQYFHEATGNEGASFERTYRRAALVLWPRARRLAVLNQAGPDVTLPYLADLASRWAHNGEDKESVLWREAHALTAHVLADWPASNRYAGTTQADRTTSILSSLVQLDDTAHVDAFLAMISASGIYNGGENAAMARAAMLLAPSSAADRIEQIIARHAHMRSVACADLLARVTAVPGFAATPALLHPSARALVETLLGERVNTTPPETWQSPAPVQPGLIDDLLTSLYRIDAPALADRFVDHVLGTPTFGMDAILVPAALALTERTPTCNAASVRRLRAACLEHLGTRIAAPLAPPADFARSGALACQCEHCAEMALFLADAARQKWVFKAAEQHRRHVEASIRQSNCDLDTTTSVQGRPYSLICTKNQASYERRVVQRNNDLANLARLDVTSMT